MSVFKLKQFASTSVHAATGAIRWNYDKVELIADGVVHAIGVSSGLVAATVLVVLTAIYARALDIVVVSVYVAGLLSMLVLSSIRASIGSISCSRSRCLSVSGVWRSSASS